MTAQRDPDALTIFGHLDELRSRILWCLGCAAGGIVAGFLLAPNLIALLKLPARGIIDQFVFTKPAEPMIVYFKVACYAGFFLAGPVIAYHLWQFVRPALRGASFPLVPWLASVTLLFCAGTVFAYTVMLPAGLKVLIGMSEGLAVPMITLGGYVSFALSLIVLGGAVFEMPVLAALLTKARIVSPALMRGKRREAFFTLCVIAAVLTPTTDIFNMLLFLVPMIVLYEISILVSVFVSPPKDAADTIYDLK